MEDAPQTLNFPANQDKPNYHQITTLSYKWLKYYGGSNSGLCSIPKVTATYVHEFIYSCCQKGFASQSEVDHMGNSLFYLFSILLIILFKFYLLSRYHLFIIFKYKNYTLQISTRWYHFCQIIDLRTQIRNLFLALMTQWNLVFSWRRIMYARCT